MRIIKFISLIIAFCGLCSGNVFAQQQITLSQAINSAVKNNIAVQKIQNNIDIQSGNIQVKYGGLFPTLSLNGAWQRTNNANDNVPIVTFNQFTGNYTTIISNTNKTTFNYSLGIRSDVTLFNGFTNYESVDVAKMQQQVYYIQLEKTRQDLTLQVLSDYITVLKNRQIVKINQASLENASSQLESIKLFVEAGKKTMSDVYKQDVQVAQYELAVEQAKNNLDKSISDLVYDSNLPQDKQYTVAGTEFSPDLTLANVQTYVQQNSNTGPMIVNAINKRQDIKAAEETINLSESNLEITRNALLFPTLTGFTQYGLSAQNVNDLPHARTFTIGLNLSYPIFEGFSLSIQRQQAQINLRGANEDLTQLRNQITNDINKAVLDLKSLAKQIEISERTIKSAEQDVLQATESFRVGLATLLDVQTAQTNYNNALIDRTNLIFNFQLAQKQLEYFQGLLKY